MLNLVTPLNQQQYSQDIRCQTGALTQLHTRKQSLPNMLFILSLFLVTHIFNTVTFLLFYLYFCPYHSLSLVFSCLVFSR